MRARELRWAPWDELIRFSAAGKQDGVPALTTELALQLTWADCGHCAKRAQAEQVESFQLLCIEGELARGEWGEEGSRVFDLHETAGPRARCGQSRRKRRRSQTQARIARDRGPATSTARANRA